MAKNYIDNLSEEVRKGLKQKAEQGYCTGKPPYGYKKLDKKISIIDPETSPLMKRAFELYSQGDISLEKVIEKLYREGFKYKQEKHKMIRSQLERLLKNPFYYGVISFNNKIYHGVHEPLISKSLFDKTQIAFRKDNKPQYINDHNFAFAGMLNCAECGCTITAEIKKEKYIYYHCTGGKGKCSQKYQNVRQEELEKQFDEAIKKVSITEKQDKWIKETLKVSLEDEKNYTKERINSLTAQKSVIRDRIEKIYIDKIDGKITEEFWRSKHDQWTNELETINVVLNSFEKASIKFIEKGNEIIELCKVAYDVYFCETPEYKAKLLKEVLWNFLLMDGKVRYTYKEPFNLFVKGLNCIKDLPRRDSNLQHFG